MSIQAIAVMSFGISVILTMITGDWRTSLFGILISWAVIITDILSNKQR